MMDGPWGLEMLRLGIRHPQESVRLVALAGLERHGTGDDYDTLFDLLPIAGSKSTRIEFGTTLAKLDPERFQEDHADQGQGLDGDLPLPGPLAGCEGAQLIECGLVAVSCCGGDQEGPEREVPELGRLQGSCHEGGIFEVGELLELSLIHI